MDHRVSWHEYFMGIARVVATRSTCDRKNVGAVIVRDRTILSTGYNGSIRGMPHCDEAGHMMENGHCVATIHAETNVDPAGSQEWRSNRRGRDLHDRESLLELLQDDRQLGHSHDLLWRVLFR